jgi:hypothetical protein
MVWEIPSFLFCYNFYLIIKKIKGNFLVFENKYVCTYCKILTTLSENPTLNAIPTCKVISK